MAVFFMLLVIIVQLAFAIVAHSTVGSAVDAAARRAARPAADLAEAERRLSLELTSVVPGANEVEATVTSRGGKVHVDAAVTWSPPGPDLVPIVIRAASATPLIVPP